MSWATLKINRFRDFNVSLSLRLQETLKPRNLLFFNVAQDTSPYLYNDKISFNFCIEAIIMHCLIQFNTKCFIIYQITTLNYIVKTLSATMTIDKNTIEMKTNANKLKKKSVETSTNATKAKY